MVSIAYQPLNRRSRLYSFFCPNISTLSTVLSNMLQIKRNINQRNLKIFNLHFVKSEQFSLTWSCGSRQRDTTSSGWKLQINNLAAKGLRGICAQHAGSQVVSPNITLHRRKRQASEPGRQPGRETIEGFMFHVAGQRFLLNRTINRLSTGPDYCHCSLICQSRFK